MELFPFSYAYAYAYAYAYVVNTWVWTGHKQYAITTVATKILLLNKSYINWNNLKLTTVLNLPVSIQL